MPTSSIVSLSICLVAFSATCDTQMRLVALADHLPPRAPLLPLIVASAFRRCTSLIDANNPGSIIANCTGVFAASGVDAAAGDAQSRVTSPASAVTGSTRSNNGVDGSCEWRHRR